jgi:hypothetical protein
MHLTLDIDLDAITGDPADEAGRILRYWGGAMKQLDLTTAVELPLSDSAYATVGVLKLG